MSNIMNMNVTSLIAQRQFNVNSTNLQTAMKRLSSGLRINRTADDAAGSSISQGLTSQIRRMTVASRNVQDGQSALEIADGALSVITDNLQRIRELAVQAGNDTNSTAARSSMTNEIRSLLEENDRITSSTKLNNISLLNGSATNAIVQVGPNSDVTSNSINIASALRDTSSGSLGLVGGSATFADVSSVDLSTGDAARNFLNDIDTAITNVDSQRASVGAFQNQLDSADQNLSTNLVNFQASNSRIKDVDIAQETANLTQSQILTQASTSILSQTNDLPKMILSLLQK